MSIEHAIEPEHKRAIDDMWKAKRDHMNDAVFVRRVMTVSHENWGVQHVDGIVGYAKLLVESRWEGVKPTLSKDVENFFTAWFSAIMVGYATVDVIPNKQLNRTIDVAEKLYRESMYQPDISHPEEWAVLRSWLWSKFKNAKNPVEIGMKILWPVALAYDKDGKPTKGGPYRLDAINIDRSPDRPNESRFRAVLCHKRPFPRKHTDRIVGGIDDDGMIVICQQPITDRVIGFELTGFTKKLTAGFVKPLYGKKGDKLAHFRDYDVEI